MSPLALLYRKFGDQPFNSSDIERWGSATFMEKARGEPIGRFLMRLKKRGPQDGLKLVRIGEATSGDGLVLWKVSIISEEMSRSEKIVERVKNRQIFISSGLGDGSFKRSKKEPKPKEKTAIPAKTVDPMANFMKRSEEMREFEHGYKARIEEENKRFIERVQGEPDQGEEDE